MSRRAYLNCLIALIFFNLAIFPARADVENKIIVTFKPGIVGLPKGLTAAAAGKVSFKANSISNLTAKHRVYRIEQLYAKILEIKPEWKHLADIYVLVLPPEEAADKVAAEYRRDANVKNAAPVGIVRAFATTPNDPRLGEQYSLTKISAPQAWDRTTGLSSNLIAVIDTGVDYTHEDLVGKVATADGYNFVGGMTEENTDTRPDASGPIRMHGTEVSGVIAAATNNGKGIAGVDWQATILPVKVLPGSIAGGTMDDILQGIAWAMAKGAKIINMSFGQYSSDPNLEQLCQQAYDQGIVLVAAAGNDNISNPSYPAYYPTVLAVGATDQSDHRSIWTGVSLVSGKIQASNYGSWVDVCAPGTAILTTANGSYETPSGTSFAAPIVAGIASLIKAANPSFTNRQIMDQITREADTIVTDEPIGKRANAFFAMSVVANISSPSSDAYISGDVGIYGSATGWGFSQYVLTALQGTTLIATLENSSVSAEGRLGTWHTTGLNGAYTIKLAVTTTNFQTREAQVNVHIDNVTPEATIYYPPDGAALAGKVTIIGTAEDQNLDNYILEYGQGAVPSVYQTIKQGYSSISFNSLGSWETSGLNGLYMIRLTALDKAGNQKRNSILVTLSNSGIVSAKEVLAQANLPLTYILNNPFDRSRAASVSFRYSLSGNFDVKIYLFDLLGNLVWQNMYLPGENGAKAGDNSPSWDGRDQNGQLVANGLYIYQIVVEQRPLARGKLIVLN
ncbi:S8 family serine peptidase [Candidatus Saganbacteria bacterium]|nr:S8 family serine peptidase [Candidatus Saganbacteria bacterium]